LRLVNRSSILTGVTRAVTLKDVGERVGLTAAGVSLALRGSASIPEHTQRRVAAAAAALGYVPNAAARALRTRRQHAIGLLVCDAEKEHPLGHFAAAVLAVAEAAMRRDHALVLLRLTEPGPSGAAGAAGADADDAGAAGDADDRVTAAAAALLARTPVDGLVCVGAFGPARAAQIRAVAGAGLPYAFIGERELDGTPVPHVTTDYARGSRLAVEHLARLGHRRIALAVDPRTRDLPTISGRLDGYRDALRALGLDGSADLRLPWEDAASGGPAAGARNVRRLRETGATAVYAVYGNTTRRVLLDLQGAGVAVPQAVAVVGFGDFPGAASLPPPLTTVRQPFDRLGAAAAGVVFAGLAGEAPAWPVVLEPDLVVRDSCGAAAAGLRRQPPPAEEVVPWE
jgi:DNA-binding LacI/PurR family transcriptional regulator